MRYIFLHFHLYFPYKIFFPSKSIFFSANNVYFVKNTNIFSKKIFFFQLSFATNEQPYSSVEKGTNDKDSKHVLGAIFSSHSR